MEGVRNVVIDPERAGQRVDNYLMATLKGVPRSRVYRIIRKGEVRVNGARVKPEYKLRSGDSVRIPPVRMAPAREETAIAGTTALAEAVLHEDERLLVLNKPAGLAVHGGSGIRSGLIEQLRVERKDLPYLELVHRLDRDTSGCLLLAKKRSELRLLHEMLRKSQVDKRYLALVEGHWPASLGEIAAPLTRAREDRGGAIARVASGGRQATTRFRVVERFPDFTLVEANPATGRTHQIRVHAQFAGHPVLGDARYGTSGSVSRRFGRGLGRMYLHASEVTIPATDSTPARSFTAPLDDRFLRMMEIDEKSLKTKS